MSLISSCCETWHTQDRQTDRWTDSATKENYTGRRDTDRYRSFRQTAEKVAAVTNWHRRQSPGGSVVDHGGPCVCAVSSVRAATLASVSTSTCRRDGESTTRPLHNHSIHRRRWCIVLLQQPASRSSEFNDTIIYGTNSTRLQSLLIYRDFVESEQDCFNSAKMRLRWIKLKV